MNKFICNSRRGYTLVEVILTIAIFGIVVTTIYSINLFGIRSFALSNERAENQFEVRMPIDFIAKKIRYADTIKILADKPTTPTPGSHQIYLENGEIVYREYDLPSTIIGTSNEGDYSFIIEKSVRGSNILNYKIGKNGTDKYDLRTEVVALNLKEGISGDDSGTYIEFFTKDADSVTPVSIIGLVGPPSAVVALNTNINNPIRITANMSDGTTRQVTVRWTPSKIDTTSTGYKSSIGRVVGYADTVTFNVLVGEFAINDIQDIVIEKNRHESFNMPDSVVAGFFDGDNLINHEVKVLNWSNVLDTSSPGIFESFGTVSNYFDNEDNLKEFKLTLIVNDLYIDNVQNISRTVNQGVSFSLPSEVEATMSDGSISYVPISWTPSTIDTSTIGTKYSSGTVSGYDQQVTYSLKVIANKLVIGDVIVQKGSGNNKNGVVIVKGIIGATVIIRDGDNKIMKNGIVIGQSGEVIINDVDTRDNKHGVKTVKLEMSGWIDSDIWYLDY